MPLIFCKIFFWVVQESHFILGIFGLTFNFLRWHSRLDDFNVDLVEVGSGLDNDRVPLMAIL